MTEKELDAMIRDAATMLDWKRYHTHRSDRSPAGFPDLVLAHPAGGVIFAELKSDRGRLTPAQQEWADVLAAAGAEVWVVYPKDLEAFVNRLARRAEPRPGDRPDSWHTMRQRAGRGSTGGSDPTGDPTTRRGRKP